MLRWVFLRLLSFRASVGLVALPAVLLCVRSPCPLWLSLWLSVACFRSGCPFVWLRAFRAAVGLFRASCGTVRGWCFFACRGASILPVVARYDLQRVSVWLPAFWVAVGLSVAVCRYLLMVAGVVSFLFGCAVAGCRSAASGGLVVLSPLTRAGRALFRFGLPV